MIVLRSKSTSTTSRMAGVSSLRVGPVCCPAAPKSKGPTVLSFCPGPRQSNGATCESSLAKSPTEDCDSGQSPITRTPSQNCGNHINDDDMTNSPTALDTDSAATLTSIVELACRAPSLPNGQPGRWVLDDTALHLFADHTRIGHRTDSAGREVILSCGVALDHLQVAAAAAGLTTTVDRFPDPHDQNHLASITVRRAESVTDHNSVLGEPIAARRTDRLAFGSPEPSAVLDHLLHSVVDRTVALLDVIDDERRAARGGASRPREA